MAIKNYLKSVKDITAPLNWKSSPDSPKTQLAYITQPEIDMLVKANIHGSMKGKPNMGPKGIISLDGGGSYEDETGGRSTSINKSNQSSQMDMSNKQDQDKRQAFRDRTGSNVVTEDEIQGRKDLGRDAADTSAPDGGITNTTVAKSGGDEDKKTFGEKWRSFVGLPPEKWKKGMKIPGFEDVGEVSQSLYNKIYQLREAGMSAKDLKNVLNMGTNQDTFSDKNLKSLGEAFGDGDLGFGPASFFLNSLKKPSYENEFLGSAGAAGILKKLNTLDDDEKQDYINRILAKNKGAEEIFGYPAAAGLNISPSEFEQKLIEANQGNKNFDRINDAQTFYTLNPPRTQGDLEAARAAGVTYIPGFGPVDPKRDSDRNNNQSGIMTAAPVVPPVVPDPMIPVSPIPAPGTTPPNTTPTYPGSVVNDYTNMGIPNIYGNQQIPTYGYANYNQTGQPVGLQSYLDNLRKRFGIG